MSTSFSDGLATVGKPLVINFAYPEIHSREGKGEMPGEAQHKAAEKSAGPSSCEIEAMVRRARADAEAQTERRLRQEYEQKASREAAQIRQALEAFLKERKEYFARVESQIVRLALSIAAKILHREAQVDPTLVAALVRIAVENMNAGSKVMVRVRPEEALHWRTCLGDATNGPEFLVIEDPKLVAGACVLETEMGAADFSIDAQLEEVERGFLDLLAQRPT